MNVPGSEEHGLVRFYGPRTWADITLQGVLDDITEAHLDVIPLMSTSAKAYYLPAFMIMTLRHWHDKDENLEDWAYRFREIVVYTLTSRFFIGDFRPLDELVTCLSPAERKAVVQYLRYIDTYGDVDVAEKDDIAHGVAVFEQDL